MIPNIDYRYWAARSPFYADGDLPMTIKLGLAHAARGGLISVGDYQSPRELVDAIQSRIRSQDLSDLEDNSLLLIFDLIQGWGGKQGRRPYWPRRGELASRSPGFSLLADPYRELIAKLLEARDVDTYNQAHVQELVRLVEKFPSVGLNFASKHLYFWSMALEFKIVFYIYDTRMSDFMKAIFGVRVEYFSYLSFLENIRREKRLGCHEAERGLFAFSGNYFKIGSPLRLQSLILDRTDWSEAQALLENCAQRIRATEPNRTER